MSAVKELSAVAESEFPSEWFEITAEGHFWLDWRFHAFRHQLDALGLPLSAAWRGLDIGCGHGVVRRQLDAATAWTTDGADIHREALAQNRAARGDTYLYDIHDRRAELAARYDFILLFDVIEHIDDPQAFLASVLYHLKPGGWLFVNVPALESMRSSFDDVVGHRLRYDRPGLAGALRAAGLALRDLRYWGCAMLPYLLLRRLTSPRQASVTRVIERGVLPPAAWMDAWIRRIMALETRHLHRPWLGTSLLAAAVKPASPGGGG